VTNYVANPVINLVVNAGAPPTAVEPFIANLDRGDF